MTKRTSRPDLIKWAPIIAPPWILALASLIRQTWILAGPITTEQLNGFATEALWVWFLSQLGGAIAWYIRLYLKSR